MLTLRFATFAAVLLLLFMPGADATAAPKKAAAKRAPTAAVEGAERPSPKPASTMPAKGKGGKVMRFNDGFVIEGKIHKPNTFYVLQRSSINYDWETLREGFLPKILDSLKRPPF